MTALRYAFGLVSIVLWPSAVWAQTATPSPAPATPGISCSGTTAVTVQITTGLTQGAGQASLRVLADNSGGAAVVARLEAEFRQMAPMAGHYTSAEDFAAAATQTGAVDLPQGLAQARSLDDVVKYEQQMTTQQQSEQLAMQNAGGASTDSSGRLTCGGLSPGYYLFLIESSRVEPGSSQQSRVWGASLPNAQLRLRALSVPVARKPTTLKLGLGSFPLVESFKS